MTEVSDSPGLAMAERGLFGLQILAGDVEGFMLAEGELGRMDAAIRAGGQGAAFKAVAGAVAPVKPRRDRVCLEDVGDRARCRRSLADPGKGEEGHKRPPLLAVKSAGTPARNPHNAAGGEPSG